MVRIFFCVLLTCGTAFGQAYQLDVIGPNWTVATTDVFVGQTQFFDNNCVELVRHGRTVVRMRINGTTYKLRVGDSAENLTLLKIYPPGQISMLQREDKKTDSVRIRWRR
jgi:hypothetical protein